MSSRHAPALCSFTVPLNASVLLIQHHELSDTLEASKPSTSPSPCIIHPPVEESELLLLFFV